MEMMTHNPESPLESLMTRLQEIDPSDMAAALCTLEFHDKMADFLLKNPNLEMDQNQLFFSRGLKKEIQSIYLELANHLKFSRHAATPLLEAVFDLLSQTLRELVQVPNFLSDN